MKPSRPFSQSGVAEEMLAVRTSRRKRAREGQSQQMQIVNECSGVLFLWNRPVNMTISLVLSL